MHENGRGVAKNMQIAYFWLLLASVNGDENIKKTIETIKKELTTAEKQAAEEDAENCLHK